MADQIKLDFTISPNGEITISVRGAKGKACLKETRPFEEGLSGGKIESRTLTNEYYEEPAPDLAPVGATKGRHKKSRGEE